MKYTNQLVKETSPYLLQHAHNPVNWYPWGEEAFEKAKKENKLVLISIGYSACHWCHVMEEESFENETVAQVMNDNFICIKVDREERPDVDQVYMEAVQIMTGRGGWPLNCFVLPDKRPIYGGTYFQKENWTNILSQLSSLYKEDPQKLEDQAAQLLNGIQQYNLIPEIKTSNISQTDLTECFEKLKANFDTKNGGMNGAPKFPMPVAYNYLLDYQFYTKDTEALNHTLLTLNKMAAGGIYDQIGGGFARYSVDEYWFAPHFEKMLYDNAQLIELYSKAYQISKDPLYKQVVKETIEFVERELTSKEFGFYSALDADSEGEEGKFYVWEYPEFKEVLKEDTDLVGTYFGVSEAGNWESNNNILYKASTIEELSKKFDLEEAEIKVKLDRAKKKLLKAREDKVRPGLDDKILSSWNGLMLKALVKAYRVFQEERYLELALKNASFLQEKMIKDDFRLDRNYKKQSSINGFLDDYAHVVEAYLVLYEATFNEEWLLLAKNLTNYTFDHFFDKEKIAFYYSSKLDEELIVRKTDLDDNVIPSAVGTMTRNLSKLSQLTDNLEYSNYTEKLIYAMMDRIAEAPYYYAGWASLALNLYYPSYEVAFVGKNAKELFQEFDKNYLPGIVYAGSTFESDLPLLKNRYLNNSSLIYVCQDKACKLPVETPSEAFQLMNFNLPDRSNED